MIERIKFFVDSPLGRVISILIILVAATMNNSCNRKKEKPNILLITVDTLRRDHLGAYGYPRNTSPYLDELAQSSLLFKNAVTPIPLTAPSHASILTSLHPFTHELTYNGGVLDKKVQTITEVLKKNGYFTMGSVAVKILSSKYGFSQGFDTYSDKWGNKKKNHTFYERCAPSVTQSVFEHIDQYLAVPEKDRKPFFIWVHYYDPHYPYHDLEYVTFKNKLRKNELREGMRLYDKEIYYTDEHIKKLHAYLKEKGLSQRLITCITADHGEEFGEHGHVNCHVDFYSETTFVPLILNGYGIPKNTVIDTCVSTMDIGVTLLAAANLSYGYPSDGIDLLKIAKKPEKYNKRKFFILGDMSCTRSLQLVGYPYDYILNFDSHYKYWYFFTNQDTQAPDIPETHFKPIPAQLISENKKNSLDISFPNYPLKSPGYLLFKADLVNNRGASVQIKLHPFSATKQVNIQDNVKQITIFYPVTFPDLPKACFEFNNKIILENVRYAYVSKKKFLSLGTIKDKRKNQLFGQLNSLRKKKSGDELYNLSKDIEMEKNLVTDNELKSITTNYKKCIYDAYDYYCKIRNKLMPGLKKKELSEEEKKMLKSLGYL